MWGFDDLLFLLYFDVFSNVHSPVEHNWLIVGFPGDWLPLFTLSFLEIFKHKVPVRWMTNKRCPFIKQNVGWKSSILFDDRLVFDRRFSCLVQHDVG